VGFRLTCVAGGDEGSGVYVVSRKVKAANSKDCEVRISHGSATCQCVQDHMRYALCIVLIACWLGSFRGSLRTRFATCRYLCVHVVAVLLRLAEGEVCRIADVNPKSSECDIARMLADKVGSCY